MQQALPISGFAHRGFAYGLKNCYGNSHSCSIGRSTAVALASVRIIQKRLHVSFSFTSYVVSYVTKYISTYFSQFLELIVAFLFCVWKG